MIKPIVSLWHNQVITMGNRKNVFDQKFGEEFIKSVPTCPGVYEMTCGDGSVIYVGKAKNLRRRLSQYRNSRRCKAHAKMRTILKEACDIRFAQCTTDLEALLLENKLIQDLKPKFNVAGAFSFLYPCIGTRHNGSTLQICYSTSPNEFQMFKLFGAYRSRALARDGFFALTNLLEYIGHRESSRKFRDLPKVRYSSIVSFRQIPESWMSLIESLLIGESLEFLERAILFLIEKPTARVRSDEIQEAIDSIKRFYRWESRPLRNALHDLKIDNHFVAQADRDCVFLRSRYLRIEKNKLKKNANSSSSF